MRGILRTSEQQARARDGRGKAAGDRLRRASVDFEAFFLSQALQPMFVNLGAEEPFGGDFAEDMWRSMQVDEYGKAIARAGGIGVTDAVMRQFLMMQEKPGQPKP